MVKALHYMLAKFTNGRTARQSKRMGHLGNRPENLELVRNNNVIKRNRDGFTVSER